ncbi:hypothetical protein ABZ848_01530 [Streptomyces sp. NPDC047081]|uniref:hypothetical protein n=1 Tax=Streptomyces sp. NPDC047081 TaxID=3154706 RepID=UPI00340EAC86
MHLGTPRPRPDGPPQLSAATPANEPSAPACLGDEAYEQAYAEGTAMSYDEGLDYALGDAEA